jgi:hypothetical protein
VLVLHLTNRFEQVVGACSMHRSCSTQLQRLWEMMSLSWVVMCTTHSTAITQTHALPTNATVLLSRASCCACRLSCGWSGCHNGHCNFLQQFRC